MQFSGCFQVKLLCKFGFSILGIIATESHKLRNLGNNFLIVFPCWKVSCYKADIVLKVLPQVRGLRQQVVKGGFIIMDTLKILQKFIYKPCGF